MHIMQTVNSLSFVSIEQIIKDLEAKKEFVSYCIGNVIAYDEKMCRDTLDVMIKKYREKGPSSLTTALHIIERNEPEAYLNFMCEFTSLNPDLLLDNDYSKLPLILWEAREQLDYLIYTFKRIDKAKDSFTKAQILRGLVIQKMKEQ